MTKIYNLDGLDLDWEFPSSAEVPGLQKIHFAQLIYELKKKFNQNKKKLVLSAAVAAPQVIVDQSYEVPELAESVIININFFLKIHYKNKNLSIQIFLDI